MPSVVAKLKEIGTFISKQNDARPLAGTTAASQRAADSAAGPNPLHANLTCVAQKDVDHTYNDIRQVPMKGNSPADLAKCCALCKADAKCAVASLHHGSASAPFFWCELKATKDNPRTVKTKGEELSVSCAPR